MQDQKGRTLIRIEGYVQGVGFRPFVFNLAKDLGLVGWVNNDTEGVNIEIVAKQIDFQRFMDRLKAELPPLAQIRSITFTPLPLQNVNYIDFTIRESEETFTYAADVLPDFATCSACINDITDHQNRRYQYVFTNCTHCGPRFSIIESLPYDRQNTTMRDFQQCDDCLQEYKDPRNRRFHAQPNACPKCGPQVSFKNQTQVTLAEGFQTLEESVVKLREGKIIAIKGIGGYQLAVDASNTEAIKVLRARKKRQRKPFALMVPNLEMAQSFCEMSPLEKKQLLSPIAPIVLLKRKSESANKLSALIAPNNPYLGVFLPNSPLHFWLLKLFGAPLIVTSANLSDEPLVYAEPEVFERLEGIADFYLVHNRPIARPIDDSVVQVIGERVFVLRAARGLAPLRFDLKNAESVLAVGPHMKNTFSFSLPQKIIVSQHLGEMEADKTQELFNSEVSNYLDFYHVHPNEIIHDAHPGYATTEWAVQEAERLKIIPKAIQHHRAHIWATVADQRVSSDFLGVSWDGTGYGDDGTIWGGEIFLGGTNKNNLPRIGTIQGFSLLGGEASVRAPWRVALALLFEVDEALAKKWFFEIYQKGSTTVFATLQQMQVKGVHSPRCSSMGRLFEGVGSLLNIVHENDFEADAAIQLEYAALSATLPVDKNKSNQLQSCLPWNESHGFYVLDWRGWVRDVTKAILDGQSSASLALEFHQLMAESLINLASKVNRKTLVLGGGVFQNRLLMGELLRLGSQNSVTFITPERIPINDGGISLGQVYSVLT